MSKFFCFVVCLCLAIGCSSDSNIGTVPFELSDPDADVTITVDGKSIQVTSLRQPFKFTVGDHELRVEGARYETIERTWQVVSGVNPVFKIDLIPVKAMAEASATSDSTPDTERVPGSGVSEDVAETEPPKEEPVGDSIDSTEKEQQASTSPAEELIALTPNEMELIQWAQQEKGAIVMPGEGLGLVFPLKMSWSEDDFKRFQDLPHLHTLIFHGWYKVQVVGPNLTDDHLLKLSGLPKLRDIGAQGPGITDRTIEHLAQFPIVNMTIQNSSITNEGLTYFSRHSLGCLRLDGNSRIGDEGLSGLDLSKVWSLKVGGTSVTNHILESLNGSTKLVQLSLNGTKITGEGISVLQDRRSLPLLSLRDLPIEDEHLRFLQNLKDLSSLDIRRTRVTADGVRYIASSFPKLDTLKIDGLKISESQIIDWRQLQNLVRLDYWSNHIGNRQLQSFTAMKNLRLLLISTDLKYFSATRQGLLAFKESLPNCEINGKSVDELIHELSQ